MRRHQARGVSLLSAVAVLLAGCTAVVDGSALKVAGGPAPGTVDVALLNPGNYPTKPQPPMGVAGTPAAGALLEGRRMAEFVIGPWEVDPALVAGYHFLGTAGAFPLKSDGLEAVVFPPVAKAVYKHNYIGGYVDAREVQGQKVLFNFVLRMADPESASAAARDMAQATRDNPAEGTSPAAMSPIPIPGHPEANAISHSFDHYGDNLRWHVVESYTAHGPYVLMQKAQSTENSDIAVGLIAKAIDMQAPRIDGFTPTDPAQLPNLPRDPTGLLAKALPVPEGSGLLNNRASFVGYGLLHYQIDPVASAKVFADAGVDVGVSGDDWVIQARDAAGAAAVADDAVKDFTGTGATPVDPVPNLPGSRCLKLSGDDGGFWCVATADRYEVEVSGLQLTDVYQRTAAQYIILTAK